VEVFLLIFIKMFSALVFCLVLVGCLAPPPVADDSGSAMQKALVGVAALLASAEAFSPAAAPRAVSTRAVSPVMSEEGVTTRRALLAAVVLGAPAAANAMAVPGLNSPGLVPARKVPKQPKPDFESAVRDNGSLNHFWNNKGIMNSVPKMKGIITPKSTCNNNDCGRFDDYTFNPKFQD